MLLRWRNTKPVPLRPSCRRREGTASSFLCTDTTAHLEGRNRVVGRFPFKGKFGNATTRDGFWMALHSIPPTYRASQLDLSHLFFSFLSLSLCPFPPNPGSLCLSSVSFWLLTPIGSGADTTPSAIAGQSGNRGSASSWLTRLSQSTNLVASRRQFNA